MSKFLKGIISGIVIGAVTALSVPTIAKNVQESIDIVYNNIKVYTDGKEANTGDTEPFIYNGTVYMPIRATAEALGINVDWDSGTKSVYLTSKNTDSEPAYSSETELPQYLSGKYIDYEETGIEMSVSIFSSYDEDEPNLIGNASIIYNGTETLSKIYRESDELLKLHFNDGSIWNMWIPSSADSQNGNTEIMINNNNADDLVTITFKMVEQYMS